MKMDWNTTWLFYTSNHSELKILDTLTSTNGLSPVEQIVDVPGPLMVKSKYRPHCLHLTFAFMGVSFS